jgi:hypothetical protein
VKNPTTVGTLAPLVAYLGEPSVEVVNPTSDSPGSWNYSTSDQKIAKVKNGVIVPIAEGVVTVTATQNATEIYDASTPVQTTLVVGPAMQTPTVGNFDNLITFIQPNPIKVVPPASTSSGAWSYKSSNSAILESDGEFLTPVGVGLVTVTASQARTNTFGRFEKTFQVKVGESFTVTSAGGKNLITIKSSSPDARVTIDGQPAHLGGNKVVAGSHQVKVYINGFLALQTRTSATGLKKVKK